MFRWYSLAEQCYAYLEDILSSCLQLTSAASVRQGPGRMWHVSTASYFGRFGKDYDGEAEEFWLHAFVGSRWFTRGWTLQELIAPPKVAFFGCDWNFIGVRDGMLDAISKATKIDTLVLAGSRSVSSVSVASRMAWAADRKTSRIEDQAYSLLGLFEVNMPMLYGEGVKAFQRLQEEIIKTSTDHSILAWDSGGTHSVRLLAESPSDFAASKSIVPWGTPALLEMTTRGLRASLPMLKHSDTGEEYFAILNCRMEDNMFSSLALRVRPYHGSDVYRVLEPDLFGEGFSRLTTVDAKHVDGTSSKPVEIMRVPQAEGDAVRQPKLCICLADGSYPAKITETGFVPRSDLVAARILARTPKSVVFTSGSRRDGQVAALVKFESGEQVITLVEFDFRAVFSFGIHAWFAKPESGPFRLSEIIERWSRPIGVSIYPHDASLFDIPGKKVTADVIDRIILGERVIMASVSMIDYLY